MRAWIKGIAVKLRDEYADDPVRIGISTCLLGQKVRFDAGHKRDRFITDILGQFFQFVPVCPELEVGMGVPREAVRLEGSPEAPRMIGNKTGADWTDRMNAYSRKRVAARDLRDLSGYILKKDSPSCGMERVKVYGNSGMPHKSGRGLFAMRLLRQFPLLPIEEEGRLNDAAIRENFIERVFAYHSLQGLFKGRFSAGKIVRFHTINKYLLLSHSPKLYRELGALVAAVKKHAPDSFREAYGRLYMDALAVKTTARKNVNVLQHILGFMKKDLPADDKKYILDIIEDYRQGLVPLVVPISLIKNFIRKYDVTYIADQTYLNPHPKQLMLRNHV
jgi:uncharacterized protein YbgA (DUF1722 family)/uncharacterized protein YbbK (DUF523 family)